MKMLGCLRSGLAAGALLSALCFGPPVKAQPAPQFSQTQTFGAWTKIGRAPNLTAGTGSTSTILNFAGPVARVCNASATIPAYVQFGDVTVTATVAGGDVVLPNSCFYFNASGATYVAAITASSTADVSTTLGTGSSH